MSDRAGLLKSVVLAAVLSLGGIGTSGIVRAAPTTLTVRAIAGDGKSIGDAIGGVQTVVRDATTGELLDEAVRAGGSGDARTRVADPRERRTRLGGPPAAEGARRDDIRAWRAANERSILEEFVAFLSFPNVARTVPDIHRNADYLESRLRERGFQTRKLDNGPDTPPAVFGQLATAGAERTVLFYAHFDGQPAGQPGWVSEPWTPQVRSGPVPGTSLIDWRAAETINPEWRVYARSASDDKGPILALLTALDALRATGRQPAVNVKVIFEGEEEVGSPNLHEILAANRDLLAADAIIVADGPMHQSGRPQILYGARGAIGAELTVYGPVRPLHSGHYGNWAPNPAASLVQLLASVRDDEGTILIPGFAADVRPLTEVEREALRSLPDVESALLAQLGLGRTEGGERLMESVMRPSINIRGLAAGGVGENASNAIPTEARASMDFRLVPGQTPEGVRSRFEAHLRSLGWTLTSTEPDDQLRLSSPRLVRLEWSGGYPAYRADLSRPDARAVARVVQRARDGEQVLIVPMTGGSVPLEPLSSALGIPVYTVPIVNFDNNQHGANENLRIGNLWNGIEIYAALLGNLTW